MSTQTLAEEALEGGDWDLAAELTEYFVSEIRRMNDVLFVWLADILDYRIGRAAPIELGLGATLLTGLHAFDPGRGDLERALRAVADRDAGRAVEAIELMRVRWAAQHDGLVVWNPGAAHGHRAAPSARTPCASR